MPVQPARPVVRRVARSPEPPVIAPEAPALEPEPHTPAAPPEAAPKRGLFRRVLDAFRDDEPGDGAPIREATSEGIAREVAPTSSEATVGRAPGTVAVRTSPPGDPTSAQTSSPAARSGAAATTRANVSRPASGSPAAAPATLGATTTAPIARRASAPASEGPGDTAPERAVTEAQVQEVHARGVEEERADAPAPETGGGAAGEPAISTPRAPSFSSTTPETRLSRTGDSPGAASQPVIARTPAESAGAGAGIPTRPGVGRVGSSGPALATSEPAHADHGVQRTTIGTARPIGALARRLATAQADPTEEPQRPHLSLVTPAPAQAPQHVVARSAAERLAAQTGGTLEQGEGGLRTVHFPPPEIPGLSTQQPYTISRELDDTQASSVQQSSAAEPPAASGGPAMDPEAMYEYFLDRFKRDLLIEREQLGHLIIDNP
jgi:hypothetical protein